MGAKIVVDTNNLISALGWEGNSRELLRQVLVGEHELYISRKQLMELQRVMDYPKFKFTSDQKSRFLDILHSISIIIDTTIVLSVVEDNDDNIILETAIEAGAEYIISGDAHLRKLRIYNGIRIVTVQEFLNA